MSSRVVRSGAVFVVMVLLVASGSARAKPVLRKPPPAGVTELTGLGLSSLVELQDGSLLGTNGQVSTDGGQTWSEPRPFGEGIGGNGLVRLQSGAIALYGAPKLWLSRDEGQTWAPPVEAKLLGDPFHDALVQLSSGRLLWPSRECFGNYHHQGLAYMDSSSYGMWRGRRLQLEGHGHIPEVSIAAVSHSDDEGQSWHIGQRNGFAWEAGTDGRYSSATLMGWFDSQGNPTNGDGWVTDCDEPTVAETTDGRVLFFARSTVGRIVYSYSADAGETWTPVLPTELASSYSPPRLVRIPKTGDLMCVWNQLSGEEIRRGYRRGRLSVAISQDSGETWGHFKTLEVSGGLEDVARVYPDWPIPMVVRARKNLLVPDDFAWFSYSNVCFAGDKVYIMYGRGWPEEDRANAELASKPGEQVLRIYPLEWFYEEDA